MAITRRNLNIALPALALGTLTSVRASRAQSYPSQDVHFICGFAAGSGADVIVRFYAEKLRPLMGRNIVVENKPGALGSLASETVARAKPDGYTIQIAGASSVASYMHLFKNPPIDFGKALQVAATISQATMMLAVRPESPFKNLPDLTAAMKQKGDKATYGYATPIAKAIGAMFKQKAGLNAVDVGYRTGADFLNDLASGNLDYVIADNIQAMAQVRAGRMRLLAVGASQRMQAAADIPTMTEFGYPVDIRTWWGAIVPAGTPRPIIDQLNVWVSQVTASDDAKKFLNSFASDPWVSTPEQSQAYFLQQIKEWGEYVKLAKIEQMG
jgi:tripartite-type tricarboxylate transporter receptor subunit TctC